MSDRTGLEDPLGVLASTHAVIEAARYVTINREKVTATAIRLAADQSNPPAWDSDLHPVGRDDAETATLILVLDALNFCFWPMPDDDRPRWRVTYQGRTYDGYAALAVALRRAVENGIPIVDPDYLAEINNAKVAEVLAGDPGTQEIPLLDARTRHLQEAGEALRSRWAGTFLNPLLTASGSGISLIREVVETLPSFDDTECWRDRDVRFYKRAQILIADLHGAFNGAGAGRFHDLDALTAFADYKVPQVLREFGILEYAPDLAGMIDRFELIPPGDEREVEIRAATIWAVEHLRRELSRLGVTRAAHELDWLLWNAGQSLSPDAAPYHRTLTVYY